MKPETLRYLREIYSDPRHPAGFGGLRLLLHHGKRRDPSLTRDDVKQFLSHLDPYTLFKQNRRHFPRLKIRVKGANRILSADLADFQRIAHYNDGYRYALVGVDAFSRYAWVVPLKTKSGLEVANGLEGAIFSRCLRYQRIHVDQGKEFYNHIVTSMLARYNCSVYSTYNSKIKAAHAERFIRTLKGKLYRAMNLANTWRWLDFLPDVVHGYNHRPHSAFNLKYTPFEVHHENELQEKIKRMLYDSSEQRDDASSSHHQLRVVKYKPGDVVRLSQSRALHYRGYFPQNSEELFKVKSMRVISGISTYRLKDLNNDSVPGIFYDEDLVLAAEKEYYPIDQVIRERGKGSAKEYFVSFIGYPASFNAWVKAGDLQKI